MKRILSILQLVTICFVCKGQSNDVSLIIGAMHTVALRTSDDKVGNVKFLKPVRKTFGILFDKHVYKKLSCELGLQVDDYDAGYEMAYKKNNLNGLEISAGKLNLGWSLLTYKMLTSIQYEVIKKRKFNVNIITGFCVSYFQYNKHFSDTSYNVGGPLIYQTLPAYQKQGINFLALLGIEAKYSLKKRIYLSLRTSYQHGIRQFFYDETRISIRDEPQRGYTTTQTFIYGSTFQGHFGFGYKF